VRPCSSRLVSLSAVDIDQGNVDESRDRLRWVIASHVYNDLVTWSVSDEFASAVNTILTNNIVRGFTLSEARTIEFIGYKPGRPGTFARSWSYPGKPSGSGTTRPAAPLHGDHRDQDL
jgi:hypothetical protein